MFVKFYAVTYLLLVTMTKCLNTLISKVQRVDKVLVLSQKYLNAVRRLTLPQRSNEGCHHETGLVQSCSVPNYLMNVGFMGHFPKTARP